MTIEISGAHYNMIHNKLGIRLVQFIRYIIVSFLHLSYPP